MQLVVYGKLRSDGPFNFLLPKKSATKRDVRLSGFRVYDLGRSLGAVRSGSSDSISCELWSFRLPKWKEVILLFTLDTYENFIISKYQRVLIPTKYGEGWIYLYTGDVATKKIVDKQGR